MSLNFANKFEVRSFFHMNFFGFAQSCHFFQNRLMESETKPCGKCDKPTSLWKFERCNNATSGSAVKINRSLFWATCECGTDLCNECRVPVSHLTNVFCTACKPFSSYTITPLEKSCDKCHIVAVHGDKVPQTWCGTGIKYELYWQKCNCGIDICSDCRVHCKRCSSVLCSTCFDAHVFKPQAYTQPCHVCHIEQKWATYEVNEERCGFDANYPIFWETCEDCNVLRCPDCSLTCKCDAYITFCPKCHVCKQ